MTHADITATVVSFDPSVPAASSALVVMTPVGSNKTDEDSQEEKQNSETEEAEVGASPTKRSLKAVRMNTDELVPIPEFRSPFASLSPKKKKKPIVDVVMPHAEHEEVTKVKLEDSFYRLLDHLFVSDSPRPCSSTKTVLLAQCRARTLKVLHEMLQAADSNLERLFLERDDKIIASILSLSSRIIKRENFFTLDGMEVRAIELRKRLHQLLVDKQSHPYSCYSGTTSPDEGESKVEPVADLTVDVEESFSDIEDEDETEAIEEEEEADTEEEDEDYQVNVDLCSVGETAEEKMNALMYSDDEEDEDEDEDEDEEEDEEDEDHILDKDVNSPPMYLVEELMAMGFPEEWCVIALRIQGLDLLAASTWIVDNLDMLSSTPIHELTQGPSGAASPPSRVGSRAVSHDPDAQEEHKLEDSMETHQEEQRKQQEQQMLKKKKREADKRLARAKASVKNMNESFQQLEEELGLEVFAENSFRTDSSPSYGYGYVCGALGLYNGLHAEGTRNESSRESFRAEISLLNYEELQSMCIDMEDDLSILYARSCLVVLLQRWRQWPHEATSKIFNAENKLFLQLLKLVLFRGPQIMPSYEVSMLASRDKNLMSCDLPGFQPILAPKSGSLKHLMVDFPDIGDGCNNAFPAPPGSSSTSSSSTTKNNKTPPKERNAASGAASSVMNLLVQAVQPAVEQMVRYELGKNSESLVSTMVECALSDLELAANSAQYVDTEWGIRDLFITDKDVGNKANVEFSTWLMGLVQSEGSTSACSVQTFSRISSLLGSPNVPLKSVCCQLLCGILRTWLAREAITPQQHDAVAQLPYERLFAVAEKRAQLEQRCGRVFLSKYVSSSVELLFLRNKFDIHEPAFETIENAASIQEGTIEVVQGMRITKVDTNTITCVWHLASGASVKGFSIQLDDEPPVSTTAMRHTFSSLQPNTSYSIRVIASMESGETSCASVCKCKTLDDILFTFDSCNCGPSISISEKGLSASFSAMESWSTVLGSEGFTSGVAQWQIRIDESESPYMFVGVATRKACLTTFLGGDEHGWGYIGDRALYHKRNRVNVYGERFGQGDIIGVVLDMDQGTLSFNKNGKDLGVAIEGLSGRLYPAFAFYSGTQSVSLLRKSIKTTVADREPYYGLDNVLDSYGVLEDFAVRNCSKSVLQAAYKIYQDWMRATKFRAQTKLGHELDFERAKRHGQRIQTTLGTGTVLGTRNDKVWILYDEDPTEAWFCEEEDIVVLSDETIVNEKPHDEISFETFLEFADDKKWTLTQDQAMIAEMGSLCARRGKNPFNISMATFMSDVLPPAKMRARGSANRDKDDLTRKFEGNMDNPQMAAARVSVLKVVNGHMETALPFVGIGFGTSKIHSNVISTVFDKDSNQDRLLIANLPQKFRNIRGILFSHTKRNVLSKMLHVSATVPKRAEDDYDYPEELPQLVLNRPKASFSRSLPDAESRLSFSLFGQAFDELHFLDPSSLRIAYSHPMDEGQSRSFKVKFEGEGVDDYGGPYREVFTQWSAELSSTTWSQDGAAEDETPDFKTGDKKKEEGNDEGPTVGQQMVCVLPLLHPCPNRQHGVGTNREKFILRPHTAGGSGAHLLMEMYNFLGQLGGIALRTKTNLNIDLASMVWKPLVGESLTVEDLRDIDHSTVAITERLEQMEMCEELRWTTNTSDGTQVELFPGGAQEKVTSSNCKQYAHVLLQTRLRESESAIAAVRDGLTSVIPSTILPLFTWEELERCVCGIPEMDVGLLKQCTEYDDDISPNDSHIQSFWRVLESFSNVHRQRFLRFVWARSRLPATAKEFPQKFKVQAPVGEGPRENPDEWLPKAHTCFFALSLPRYTSDEVMKEKLLYAIQNCLEMDADFRLTETEMTGWDDQQVTSGTGPTLTIQT
uniref:HECT E3 ubiquitin ligase n=1 Tax=Mucochytrium quahogii TaxID=96639 RepID=A0A7S2RG93_9STRA